MKTSSYVRRAATSSQARLTTRVRPEAEDRCEIDCVHLDAVRSARATLPDDLAVRRMADLLALLSNPTRLKMLLALQAKHRRGPRELCVCDLAVVSGASKSLTSHQLRLLRAAGLVTARRDGKLAYYRLADGPAADLLRDTLEVSHQQPRASAASR